MKELGLVCRVRMKKCRSYKGEAGKIAPNLLNRNFEAEKPNQKAPTSIKGIHIALSYEKACGYFFIFPPTAEMVPHGGDPTLQEAWGPAPITPLQGRPMPVLGGTGHRAKAQA